MNSENKKRRISDISMYDYFGVVIRGKWIITTMLAGVWLLAFIYTRVADPVYDATSSIIINTKFAQPLVFMDALKRWDAEKNFAQNELEILKSKSLAAEVAEKLIGIGFLDSGRSKPILITLPPEEFPGERPLPLVDKIVERLGKAVDFNEIPETDVIQISAKSKDPAEAALIANTIATVYHDRNIRASRAKSRSFREFLEVQLTDRKKQLSESEDSLQDYMDRFGIVSLDDESRKLINQLADLEAQRDELAINIQSHMKMLSYYQEQIPEQQKSAAKSIGDASDPYIRLLQEQIAKLEVQRDVTVAQNPSISNQEIYNSKISEIDEQIKLLRSQLQKRTNDFLANLLPGAQSGDETASYLKQVMQKNLETKMELESYQAKKSALDNVIASYEQQFSKLPGKNIRFARLQRTKLGNEKLATTIQEKFNEAVMTEQSQFGYVEIIDSALVPNKPSRPKVFLINALGIVLGFALGVALVFIKEKMDLRVQSPEDLKREGLNIRGSILYMKGGTDPNDGNSLFALSQPFSPTGEAFKHLRTNLQYVRDGQNLHTLLITSSKPGEGKTTVVANLGVAFSQLGKKILLVDCDLRRPTLHKYFNAGREPGLTDFLQHQNPIGDVIQPTKITGVDIVSAGKRTDSTSELVNSPQMQVFVSEMQKKYDLILFDSSPILAGTEPTILSTIVNQVLVVIAAGETRLNELLRALEEITEPQGKVPGVVLNKFNIYRAYGIPYGRSGYGYYPYASSGEKIKL